MNVLSDALTMVIKYCVVVFVIYLSTNMIDMFFTPCIFVVNMCLNLVCCIKFGIIVIMLKVRLRQKTQKLDIVVTILNPP